MAATDAGAWSVTVDIPLGEIQYKYFINGQWPSDMATARSGGPADPDAQAYADDGFGGQNAVRNIDGSGAGAGTGTAGADPHAGAGSDANAAGSNAGGASSDSEGKGDLNSTPDLPSTSARVHYHRPGGNYEGWGLHTWMDAARETAWSDPLPPTGRDEFGVYWDVPLRESAKQLGFIIHKGDEKDPGPDQFLDVTERRELWIVSGRTQLFGTRPDISAFPVGDLTQSRAYWVDRRTLLWQANGQPAKVSLHVSPTAQLRLEGSGIQNGETIQLSPADKSGGANDDAAWRNTFPHLRGLPAWRIPENMAGRVPEWLRGQVTLTAQHQDGRVIDATGVQIPGVLDDLFAFDGPLGVHWNDGTPTVSVWAPTARSVELLLFSTSDSAQPTTLEMTRDNDSGTWSLIGTPDWKTQYYLFRVEVFTPSTGRIETNDVTDPYSRSLSENSGRSQFVDLNDPDLAPAGWQDVQKPNLEAFTDIVLYELHVRDFSSADDETPKELRGTYGAFTLDAPPTRHLKRLEEAGVTHVHLLPVFDIATVNERRSEWPKLPDFSGFGPADPGQQEAVMAQRSTDGFNWGYDPAHFGVPEGSYSTQPDGATRIREFREMVQSLNQSGLRVVMDVVYNHTHASGQNRLSVFDRIVPGYYHRLDDKGNVETSTCCQNTASEHYMFDRFVGDDLIHWARNFKIDGFRFDLMGHHMARNLVSWRDRLRSLTPDSDGVDGSGIYLYGEGWDFGEVQGGRRGPNATQTGLAGTGIGTFNDRIRDAVRGGNPFGDRREQGFSTGLYVAPTFNGAGPSERSRLLEIQDKVRVGLAGNLADYRFTGRDGRETTGRNAMGTGYARQPQESIQYVSAHDNETLFDKMLYASGESTTLEDCVRNHWVALSTVAFAQGVPFFHAGSEILRSKSFDADSYDSGDWFNAIDFTYEENGFGRGLPPAEKNRDRWDIIGGWLSRPELKPGSQEIRATLQQFETLLQIRQSSPLFRLRDAEEIQARVRFHNTGPAQLPGLIVMSLAGEVEGTRSDGSDFASIDREYGRMIVLFNANPDPQAYRHPGLIGKDLTLHPRILKGPDPVARTARFEASEGSLTVPGRTTVVFVEER